jgi:hypothetical protein
MAQVNACHVETEEEAKQRLTATRMIAFGVFALAMPKRTPGAVLVIVDTDRGPLVFEKQKQTKGKMLRSMRPALGLINGAVAARPASSQAPPADKLDALPAAEAVPGGPVASDGTRECPWCAERIKAAARICRYCGRDVQGASRGAVAAAARRRRIHLCPKCGVEVRSRSAYEDHLTTEHEMRPPFPRPTIRED